MSQLRIDPDRLWLTHMEMARIGALPHGGCRRLALSEEDRQGRELFIAWCREAGCTIRVDATGNIFARRPGSDDSLPPVATGSHLDTQPHGGRFDGIYGVLAGLEVIRALNDAEIVTRAPVEAIVWTNEEGVRFDPSCAGSAVFTRLMTAEALHAAPNIDGGTVGADLERCGYLGPDVSYREHPLACFIEAHIEQGPILEAEGLTIGVVTGIQGACMYTVRLTGMDGHAGTTPMTLRRDALVAASRIVAWLNRMALAADPDIRLTVGRLKRGAERPQHHPWRGQLRARTAPPAAEIPGRLRSEGSGRGAAPGERGGHRSPVAQGVRGGAGGIRSGARRRNRDGSAGFRLPLASHAEWGWP